LAQVQFGHGRFVPLLTVAARPSHHHDRGGTAPLNRASAIEDLFAVGLFENEGRLSPEYEQIDAALTSARVFTIESKHLRLLTLYEQRINRAVQKNLALLKSLQAEREAAMKDAATLLQLSEMRGLEYFPSKDGFVFSTAQIHAAIDHDNRFRQIQALQIPNPGRMTPPAAGIFDLSWIRLTCVLRQWSTAILFAGVFISVNRQPTSLPTEAGIPGIIVSLRDLRDGVTLRPGCPSNIYNYD
jgi:hypothetical protein